MKNTALSLTESESRELVHPSFPLIQKLFDLAREKGINSDGWYETNHDPITIPLSEEFNPLIANFPGTYFIVAYEDRRSSYYAEGTRGQEVKISTVKHRSKTDERTREILFSQLDRIEEGRIEVRERESIMDQSLLRSNDDIDLPHGEISRTYELDEYGNKHPKQVKCTRLDDGIFQMGEHIRPVRWLRELEFEGENTSSQQIIYKDFYIAKWQEGLGQDSNNVKTTITGDIENPTSIFVEIGSSIGTEEVLIDNDHLGLKVVVRTLVPEKNPIEILKDDPVYAPLFEELVDTATFAEGLKSRIKILQEDWDKPQSIYQTRDTVSQEVGRAIAIER